MLILVTPEKNLALLYIAPYTLDYTSGRVVVGLLGFRLGFSGP